MPPFLYLSVKLIKEQSGQQRGERAPNNVAKRSVEFFVRLAREQLRPTYGQGFRGAPLQTDTEEPRPQTDPSRRFSCESHANHKCGLAK